MTMMMTIATMNVHMNISVILVVNRFPSKGVFMKQVFASKVEKAEAPCDFWFVDLRSMRPD